MGIALELAPARQREQENRVDREADEGGGDDRPRLLLDLEHGVHRVGRHALAEQAGQKQFEVLAEVAAEFSRRKQGLYARQDEPEAHRRGRQDREHGRQVSRHLLLGRSAPVMFVGAHGELKEKRVKRGADRADEPAADVVGEREIARLGETVPLRHQVAVGERDRRIEHVGGDDRHRVLRAIERDGALRRP